MNIKASAPGRKGDLAKACRHLSLTTNEPNEQTFLRCLYEVFVQGGKVEIVLRNEDRCTYENQGF